MIDVTDKGKEILEQFFGCGLELQPNWNNSHGQRYLILLPYELLKSLKLFILFHLEECDAVYLDLSNCVGYFNEEYLLKCDPHFIEKLRWNPCRAKDRKNTNTHAFSGRMQA